MKTPELQITNGSLAGKRFTVKAEGLRLGRSSSNDIQIPDEELSRNHCLFEPTKDGEIRLTDLASANGTFLNGKELSGDPAILKAGDIIEVGETIIKVISDEPAAEPPKAVDLGLGDKQSVTSTKSRRSPVANLLWVIVVAVVGSAIYLYLNGSAPEQNVVTTALQDDTPVLEEMAYERVEADSNGIFRFELTLTKDGVLSVAVDDVPKDNRHLTKSEKLDARALGELGEIVSFKALKDLDREYIGVEPDPPALSSWTLRAVYSSRSRTIRIANTQCPETFCAIRDKLEAFSKNQLGVWALQYSREKLIELAGEAIRLGRSKWDDREVQYGNLFGAVAAYKEAIFYLETVNPKPDCMADAVSGLKESSAELERRYKDQRFLADRALNLRQWEVARRELGVLMEMIPDREDERHREAAAKLIDAEKRMKGDK